MKKIILGIFLTVCMLLTNISVIAEESKATDYSVAVDLLTKLNIISVAENSDDFSVHSYVTREEFCVYLVRAFKIDVSLEEKQIFTDVPVDSGLAPYVNALYERNIVSGYGGAFRPRDVITYNEAIKMLITVLNYDYGSETLEYPQGYLSIASGLKITKGVYDKSDLTKGAVAQLIYNAMIAPYMEIKAFGDIDISFKSNDDKSILTELYNIYEGKGVVLASKTGSLTSSVDYIDSDEIMVEDTFYNVGNTDASELLGHYIEFYYLETENDEYEIFAVLKDLGEELIIKSSQNISFEGDSYRYEDAEGRVKRVKLSDDYRIMYNFKYPTEGFASEMMEPELGRIKLIKSGKGSGYTAVIIEEYSNYVVSSVDIQNEVIYTKERVNIDLSTYDYVIYDSEGKRREISSINEWNVISCLYSSDSKDVTLYVSTEEIKGKPDSIGDADEPIVVIGSTEYYTDVNVLSKLELGKEVKLYLDYLGNIAGINKSASDSLRYAYLLKSYVDYDQPDGEGRVLIKFIDEDGSQKKYYLTKKVKINDQQYKDPEMAKDIGLSTSEKLIKYQMNDDGDINNIYICDNSSERYIRQLFDGSPYWNSKQRSFDGKVTMETDAPIFVVPKDSGAEKYKVAGLSSLVHDRKAKGIKVYTFGDNVYGEVIVIDDEKGNASYDRPIGIVKSIKPSIDENGELCTKMSVMYNGSVQAYVLESDDVLNSVEKGDVVKISLNHNNEIQDILHIYDADGSGFLLSNPYEIRADAGYRNEHRCYYGYAYDITDGLLRYCKELPIDKNKPDTENALLSAFRIYVVDGDDISIGTEKDIHSFTHARSSCSRIIVHTMWGDPEDIIVIK